MNSQDVQEHIKAEIHKNVKAVIWFFFASAMLMLTPAPSSSSCCWVNHTWMMSNKRLSDGFGVLTTKRLYVSYGEPLIVMQDSSKTRRMTSYSSWATTYLKKKHDFQQTRRFLLILWHHILFNSSRNESNKSEHKPHKRDQIAEKISWDHQDIQIYSWPSWTDWDCFLLN